MITLEQEANETIQMHKFAILTKKLRRYYEDYYTMNNTLFVFPDNKLENAHARARKEVRELFLNDREKYEELYERAYQEFYGEEK